MCQVSIVQLQLKVISKITGEVTACETNQHVLLRCGGIAEMQPLICDSLPTVGDEVPNDDILNVHFKVSQT